MFAPFRSDVVIRAIPQAFLMPMALYLIHVNVSRAYSQVIITQY